MRIIDLKKKLQDNNLLVVQIGKAKKRYVPGEEVFRKNKWKNTPDVFGIYKGIDDRYYVFISDSEKGAPEYLSAFITEHNACEGLYKKIEVIGKKWGRK